MTNKKTIQEIKRHCVDNGYSEKARTQICAFLVGAGLKGTQDVLKFKIGTKTFDDFVTWYNSEPEDLVLERGSFVLVANCAEIYPALILDVFDDACLTMSADGLFCVEKGMVIGNADEDDINHVLMSFIEFNVYWDFNKQKLLPYWHVNKTTDESAC